MADALDPRILAAAECLAELPVDKRAIEEARLHHATTLRLPIEEVGKPDVSTLGEYLDLEIELPPMLVEPGLIARGAITAMIARGGKGKTSINLNKLVRWSMGRPLFDELPETLKPIQPLRSLIIENEGAPGHFQEICQRIVTCNGYTPDEVKLARENIHVWGDGGWSGLKLDDDKNLEMVDRATRETASDVLFVEPFRGLWKGEENSSTEMSNVLDSLSEIASNNSCAVIITHHERKSAPGDGGDAMDTARGSSVMEGVCAVMERWRHVKNGTQSELSWIKSRFREAPAPLRMEFVRDSWSYEYVTEDESARAVLALFIQDQDQYFSVADVAKELSDHQQTARRLLNKLTDEGRLVRTRKDSAYVFRYKPDGDSEREPLAIS